MHVLIIGGGIGGLALAQALKKAGIQVSVFERDNSSTTRMQGYSIFLTGEGAAALRQCLPVYLWEAVLAARYELQSRLNLTTEKADLVFTWPNDPKVVAVEKRGCILDRSDLRRLLLTGLDDVHFNKTFVKYEHSAGNKITAFFNDGTKAAADLLVGADGVHSQVRKQLLGIDAEDTGVLSVVANTPLTAEIKKMVEGTPLATTALVSGPNGWSALVVRIDHNNPSKDHLFWAILAKREKWNLDRKVRSADKTALLNIVKDKVRYWHPVFQHIVEQADVSNLAFWPLVKGIKVKPWTDPAVTLLGDAIHSMPPTLNGGGNTALRDALMLCEKLIAVNSEESSMAKALRDYSEEMIQMEFSVVDGSMRVLNLATAESKIKRWLILGFLRCAQALILRKFKIKVRSFIRSS